MPDSPTAPRAKALGFALYFAVAALLLPPVVHWDGLGFIAWSQDPLHLDFGHLLYVPLLRLTRVLFSPLVGDPVLAAQLASVLGGALSFVLLWGRLERHASGWISFAGALFVATTPLFWNQAGTVEPTTLILAALLLAAAAAERYGARRSAANAALLSLSLFLLFGLHLVSVCALPWLAYLARGPAQRPPWRHAWIPLGFLSGALAAIVLLGYGAPLQKVPGYWTGFLPRFAGRDALDHAVRGLTLAFAPTEGFPVLSVMGLGVLVIAFRRGHPRPAAFLLGLPYLVLYLAFGKPLVALLLPLTIAAGILLVQTYQSEPRPRHSALRTAGLLALLVQLPGTLALGLERRGLVDERRIQAELFARALPADATMIVGPIGHHQTWYTDAHAVILPDEIHRQGVTSEDQALAFVTSLAQREAATHQRVFLTSEALEYLDWRWATDGKKLPLDLENVILVRSEEPELRLFPLVVPSN